VEVRLRRGFIREAIKLGLPIEPVFHFGNTRVLHLWGPRWLIELWGAYSRITRVPFFIYFGRFHIPIPHRRKLLMVMGRPIEVVSRPRSDTFISLVTATMPVCGSCLRRRCTIT
jgi:diacylglycerol O-acyltransferase 2, plant